MLKRFCEFPDEKLKNLNKEDLKLFAWGFIFLGGYLSLSIIPLQNIHNTYYLIFALIFFIKPAYKIVFTKAKTHKKKK
ncbi:MAG: hypothetical protein N4A44_02005 [Alphaproteobacteria bacterium]|jgi:hypothetical protein|nr:hypothetical protein [Alphaproteobacteria bacterium]